MSNIRDYSVSLSLSDYFIFHHNMGEMGGIYNQLQFFPITLMVIQYLFTNFHLKNNFQGNNCRRKLRVGCIIWSFVLRRCLDPRLFNFESLCDW